MLEKSRSSSYLPLAIVVALCVAVLCWTFSPDKYPQTQDQKHAGQQAAPETAQDIAAELVAHYTKVLAGFTAILSIISISQIYFLVRADDTARRTADAALKSANTADAQLRLSVRPHLTITPIELVQATQRTVEPRPHFLVGLQNSGPGVCIVLKASAVLATQPNVKNTLRLTAAHDVDVIGAIGVGDSSEGDRIISPLLDEKSTQDIIEGKSSLWAKIIIEYTDILRTTFDPAEFSFRYVPARRLFISAPFGQYDKGGSD